MNRLKFIAALATAIDVLSCVASSQAAPAITMSIQYNTSYDASFNPKGPELLAQPAPAFGVPFWPGIPSSDVHQFDVFMTITGLPAGDDFQSVVFDAILGPGVTPIAGGAYFGDDPLYDPPPNSSICPIGCLSVYQSNLDVGANDLKTIAVVASATNGYQGTHFRHPGELEAGSGGSDPDNFNMAPPTFLGSMFVNWQVPIVGQDSLTYVGLSDPANVTFPWTSVNASNQQTNYGPETMNQSPRSQWAVIPEPTSVMLLCSGLAGLLLIAAPRVCVGWRRSATAG